ncbi:unnamed protein product [Brassica rapa]|uniref:Malectin-like domain-containing protein n=1 Tax=Brassica campestris TaxID=3711 RepID=A0A3P6DGF5_BRACM|nr:unnamed protein product [Brassica rapa]VDD18209.1 unnamed protein product [Brassica rapa]
MDFVGSLREYLGLLLRLIGILAIIHIVQAQDQLVIEWFISLDCGLPANKLSPYKETGTGLWFSSVESFIQSGKTGRIKENPEGYAKPYETLRYFPDGIRNCYDLSVEKGRKYLIKDSFVYGNYDGNDIDPVFDLYLGPNHWAEIDLRRVNGTREEILHVPTSNSLQFCLVKTGTTTPLISTLELRPMGNDTYIIKSGSLKHFFSVIS